MRGDRLRALAIAEYACALDGFRCLPGVLCLAGESITRNSTSNS